MDLYDTIKNIALNAVASSKPCDWCYGYVKGVNPLSIALSDKLELDEDFFEFGNYKAENLEVGDRLILLRKAGGQLFLLLNVIKESK